MLKNAVHYNKDNIKMSKHVQPVFVNIFGQESITPYFRLSESFVDMYLYVNKFDNEKQICIWGLSHFISDFAFKLCCFLVKKVF